MPQLQEYRQIPDQILLNAEKASIRVFLLQQVPIWNVSANKTLDLKRRVEMPIWSDNYGKEDQWV